MSGHAATESFRQLARIVKIDDVTPHPNADRMSLALVGGWQVCIKLDEFKKGDLALYCEIDALLPTSVPEFAFLEERKEGLKSIGDKTYARIKTIKLRKELSQGLLTPIPQGLSGALKEGADCTEALGVLKYEKTADKSKEVVEVAKTWYHRLALWLYGEEDPVLPFPSFLRKSEEQRVQNTNAQYAKAVEEGEEFEMSVKLDGESMTVYCVEDKNHPDFIRTGVCSRNMEIRQYDIVYSWPRAILRWVGGMMLRNRRAISFRRLKLPEESLGTLDYFRRLWELNTFSELFNFGVVKFDRVSKPDSYFLDYVKEHRIMDTVAGWTSWGDEDEPITTYAVQGELVGPGICKNYEGLDERRFYVYRVYRLEEGKPLQVLDTWHAREICEYMKLDYIPVLHERITLPPTVSEVLTLADGKRYFSGKPNREGIVLKSASRDWSVKVISNKYLLSEED